MPATPAQTHLTVNLTRETLPLIQDLRRSYVLAHPSVNPTDADAIGYVVQLVGELKRNGGAILWPVLMSLDSESFNLPATFPNDIRYRTSIPRHILPILDRFCESELRSVFKGRIYRNFVIRAIIRAGYALTHEGFENVVIVAGDAVPAEPPAAYDPYGLMFPHRHDPSNSEDFDPSVF